MADVDVTPAAAAGAHPRDGPPPRPRRMDAGTLRFRRRRPVRWLSPRVMLGAGVRTAVTTAFGSFLDKRELQEHLRADAHTDLADRDELWVDYTADTGDGFGATYTVACLAGRRSLDIEGVDGPLPRGDVLVLGGDQVYPDAGHANYEDRLEGPFRAALPWTERDHPRLFAVPGNHDWCDGLTGFLRVFAQRGWVGGWRTEQVRSYFAVQLPHRWWLWGVDAPSGNYIDGPQLDYFRQVADGMARGDQVILATPEPAWIDVASDPHAHRNLAYIERTLLRPRGLELAVTLAGDWHHYARYSDPDGTRHKVTAGGGGAFLHPTHTLPRRVDFPVDPDVTGPGDGYQLGAEPYPTRARSRRLAFRALALPLRNPEFMAVPALVHAGLLWIGRHGLRPPTAARRHGATVRADARDLARAVCLRPAGIVTLGLLGAALVAFAEPPRGLRRPASRQAWKAAMGAVHTAAHAGVGLGAGLTARAVVTPRPRGRSAVGVTVAGAALGAVASSLTLGAYLVAANTLPRVRAHSNDTFSAARIQRYKSVLRMRIGPDGGLTGFALGIDDVVRRWHVDPDNGDPEAPWLVPDDHLPTVRLVDRFTVPGPDGGR